MEGGLVSKGFWGAVALILGGIIVADLVAHPTGVQQAGASLDSLMKTTFSGMLGGQTVQ